MLSGAAFNMHLCLMHNLILIFSFFLHAEITRSEIVNNVEAAWQSGNRDAVKVILEDAVLEQYKPSTTSNDMIIETEGKDECKTNVHSHSCKKIELLKKIRQVTAEARSSLSLADVVQGDFQGPKQSAAATAKIPYMQSCAMEYYNLFVGQILFDFEAAVQNHVYAPFENVLKFGEGVKEALGFPVSEGGCLPVCLQHLILMIVRPLLRGHG